MKRTLHYIIILSCAMLALSCTRPAYIAIGGYAQGGRYTVKLSTAGLSRTPEQIKAGIDSILTLVDTTLSGYNENSILSRFNRGEDVVPNRLLADIYSFSRSIWKETGGAVDVACGPLFDAWGFGFASDTLQLRAGQIDSLLANCGMARLRESFPWEGGRPVNPRELLLTDAGDNPRLNFNAIAQGYSCDLVADYLHSLGVHDMLVDIGEIFCEGVNPGGKPWSIGIDRPVDGNNTPGADMCGVLATDARPQGVVTSGNYRKFYVRDGRKYAHTLDPRTGKPVSHSLLSATVCASTAAMADALSTFCMVVGPQQAMAFLNSSDGLEGCLVYDEEGEMEMWTSPGFVLKEQK